MRVRNGQPGYRARWPAPSADPYAPDPPNLEKEKQERRREVWKKAQRKARAAKTRALRRKGIFPQKAGRQATPKTWRKIIAFDAKQRYSNSRQEVFNRMAELTTWSRAPRNMDEVQSVLIAMAKKVGSVYGVILSVGRQGDELIFVDEHGEPVIDPGGLDNPATTIMCAQNHEIDSGDFLKLFAARSLYAALTLRFNALDTSTTSVPSYEKQA
jgi:hypothetical protein